MGRSFDFVTDIEQGKIKLESQLLSENICVLEEKEVPYGIKYRLSDGAVIVLYIRKGLTSKIYFEKETESCVLLVSKMLLDKNFVQDTTSKSKEIKPIPSFSCHIGTDESGKGDYFGPLVIAGVFVDSQDEEKLFSLGVKDSKNNSDKKNKQLAEQIIGVLGKDKITVVCIGIERYNELYESMGKNLNKLLGWGHARAIENLLEHNHCKNAIADQFGNESVINFALMKRGKEINLVQTPKAERDVGVAAASIIARNKYLEEIAKLGEIIGEEIPKGVNSAVEQLAKKIYKEGGLEKLAKFVKLHFKTTEKIIQE